MVRFEGCQPEVLTIVDDVVNALCAGTSIDPDSLMLVGATCRDVLHSSLGHSFSLRASSDTDLGIATTDWEAHRQIESAFTPLRSSSRIRYLIAGHPVDVMPFGPVEDPTGITVPPRRGEELTVFGFNDVYERSSLLELPSAGTMRVPSVPGYTALKMAAWLDRSPSGTERDAGDLALAVHWYQVSAEVDERIWKTEEGVNALTRLDLDPSLAAAALLGSDVGRELSPVARVKLGQRWASSDLDHLAQRFDLKNVDGWSSDFVHRRTLVNLLMPTGR